MILASFSWIGCASPSDHYQEVNCSLGRYESCQMDLPADGTGKFFLENLEPHQEYVVAVLNTEPEPIERVVQSNFQIQSSFSSAGIPADEALLYETLRNHAIVSETPQDRGVPVALPVNLRARISSELYIPNPDDYQSIREGVDSVIYIRTDNNAAYNGRRITPESIESSQNVFDLLAADETELPDQKVTATVECLNQSLPELFDIIGEPLSVNGFKGLQIVLNSIPSSSGLIAGLFNFYDRFSTLDSSPLPDSNFGQYIFVNPSASAESLCLTSLHEAQHLINFDHKVLRQIPDEDRGDLSAITRYKLTEEELGLNEGYSHTIEELFVPTIETRDQIRRFFQNFSESSRSLRSVYGSLNKRLVARGYNTLLVWHALARLGGRLHHQNETSAQALGQLIQSPGVGLANLAALFEQEEIQFWTEFLQTTLKSMFDSGEQLKLWPALYEDSQSGRLHGLQFVDRHSPTLDLIYNEVHPLTVQLPLLGRSNSKNLPPQSHSLYRLIVPTQLPKVDMAANPPSQELRIIKNGASSRLFVFRVR